MSQFWIKQGNRLPFIEKTLIGGDGKPADLTTVASVTFALLNENGTQIFSNAATIVSAVDGLVRYSWGSNETAIAGSFGGIFTIVDAQGRGQSFPTVGVMDILISSTAGDTLGVDAPTLQMLRRMVGEIGETTFSDFDLAEIFNARQELEAAAYDIWSLKAADAANLVNMTEGGQGGTKRDLSDLMDHCIKMVEFYGARSAYVMIASTRSARTREITRP